MIELTKLMKRIIFFFYEMNDYHQRIIIDKSDEVTCFAKRRDAKGSSE